VTEPDPTTDIWNPLWDGTRFEEELIDLPDFQFVGAVTWDRFGNEDTAVWRDTSERAKWYYQDRDHGGPYTGLVAAHRRTSWSTSGRGALGPATAQRGA
jgi:hypothetical protein